MSDTPRTDAAIAALKYHQWPYQLLHMDDFARQLERELAEANAKVKACALCSGPTMFQFNQMRDELAEWRTLCLWGGTPEIIHAFIKGQQERIYACQLSEEAAKKDTARLESLKHDMKISHEEGSVGHDDLWCIYTNNWAEPIGKGTTLRGALDSMEANK